MIFRTSQVHIGSDDVMIVIANMSVSVALHIYLSWSTLISMFSNLGHSDTSTLKVSLASLHHPQRHAV
jgi:hypothetical protein